MVCGCTERIVSMALSQNSSIRYPAIRKRLLKIAKTDREDRKSSPWPPTKRQLEDLSKRDKLRTKRMLCLLKIDRKTIVPSTNNIGLDGSRAVWLVAQHSNRQTRELILKKFKQLYYKNKNQVFYQGIPYLADMISIEKYGQQRYGTYYRVYPSGKERRFRIINPRKLSERRIKYGLCANGDCKNV